MVNREQSRPFGHGEIIRNGISRLAISPVTAEMTLQRPLNLGSRNFFEHLGCTEGLSRGKFVCNEAYRINYGFSLLSLEFFDIDISFEPDVTGQPIRVDSWLFAVG